MSVVMARSELVTSFGCDALCRSMCLAAFAQEYVHETEGVISGIVNRMALYYWSIVEATHIFPLGQENLRIEWGFGQRITDTEDVGATHGRMDCFFVALSMESLTSTCR